MSDKEVAERKFAIGIDLGGSRIKGVLIDEKGHILDKRTQITLDHDDSDELGELWKKAVFEMVKKLKEPHKSAISSMGLSAPGLPSETNDCIAYMPGRLHGLEQFNWFSFFDEQNMPVTIINDAQAALLAENKFGAGKEFRHIVMLTLGTGVGGAILIDGKLYQGNHQRAGHLGHITVNAAGSRGITGTPGSLEDAIGNATVAERSLGAYESTRELVDAFKAGDHFAAFVWLNSVKNLSIGIVSLINAFSPGLVILGGGIAQADEALFEPLEQFLNKYEWRPGEIKTPIKKARFHHFAGAIGAAVYSMQQQSN